MRALVATAILLMAAVVIDGKQKRLKPFRLRLKRVEPTVPANILQRLSDKVNPTCNASAPCHTEVNARAITVMSNFYSYGISYVDIHLGTPPQQFRVKFDTGSTILWVARANGCQDEGDADSVCQNPTFKEPSSTTTITSDPFGLQYTNGYVKGVFAEEGNVLLGNPNCKSNAKMGGGFRFGLSMEHRGMVHTSGILGLSYPEPPVNGIFVNGDSLIHRLVGEGMEPKFSTFGQSCNPPMMGNRCNNGGMVTFGTHDTQNCGKDLVTVTVKSTSGKDYPTQFLFDVEGIWLEAEGKSEKKWMDFKFDTTTQSGANGLLVSQEMWKAFIGILPSKCVDSEDLKFCPCDIQLKMYVKINGVTMKLTEKSLLFKISDQNDLCEVLIKPSDSFVFGDPFFRSFCHHHFWNEKKITFAETK